MSESIPQLSHAAKHVVLVEFNRPASANRIQPEDLDELARLLDRCEADGEIHALVLTGNGPYFSAGFDLRALAADLTASDGRPRGDSAFEVVANRLEHTRLVVVAAINGPVLGGATDLALACDLRIGSGTAQMQMPAAQFGLPLYAGALQRYVSRLGLSHAKRLIFMAEKIDAVEMLSIGFLNELVEERAVRSRALEIASAIAAMPPGPLAAMKHVLNAAALSNGSDERQREVLRAAFDGPAVARRIALIRSNREPR